MEEYIKITPGQRKVLEILNELKPYERLEVVADKDGKPDTLFVHRSSKAIVSGMFVTFVK